MQVSKSNPKTELCLLKSEKTFSLGTHLRIPKVQLFLEEYSK